MLYYNLKYVKEITINYIKLIMKNIILYSNTNSYDKLMHYLYEKYTDDFNTFEYVSETFVKNYEYGRRANKLSELVRICNPIDTEIDINFNGLKINIKIMTLKKNNNDDIKILRSVGCNTMEEIIYKRIILSSEELDIIFKLIDTSNKFCKELINKSKQSDQLTLNISYWKKDYWSFISQNPKRPLKTLYLKEGIKEEIIEKIDYFFSDTTRDEYIENGIPYKNVFMLYGVPGSGKTSTITTIASYFNCHIYIIPISKEITDYDLINAISFMNDDPSDGATKEKTIIVIEDIDSIFTNRKKGDDNNGITLQGLLNCFDGFACVEGTLLFITANNPEVIDNAVLRSCRVDHMYELSYADKFQSNSIFNQLIKDKDNNDFNSFYKLIKNRQYTTAMLQEFLFYNRNSDNINGLIDEFYKIIDRNKPSHFDSTNQSSDKLYS